MAVSGVTGGPSRALFVDSGKKCHLHKVPSICAMDASFGGTGGSDVFPRINVRDPYKRLGISNDASEEEIQGARNFLIQKYGGHTPNLVTSRFQTPSDQFLLKTTVAFLALGALTVLFPTEEGPTLQVAISLLASIYFIHSRLRSKLRAFLYGVGSFGVAWLVGTFLMVSVIPPLSKGPRSLEVMTSVISYVLLWVSFNVLEIENIRFHESTF